LSEEPDNPNWNCYNILCDQALAFRVNAALVAGNDQPNRIPHYGP
jgi:hypothetical protein